VLASPFGCVNLDQNIPNLARCFRHRATPTPKAPVRVHGLRPFVQIEAFDLILFGVLSFGFQNEYVTAF
jgi:hypothetical protein